MDTLTTDSPPVRFTDLDLAPLNKDYFASDECPDPSSTLVILPNGYRAWVVRHKDTHGARQGLYEIQLFLGVEHAVPVDTPLTRWCQSTKGWLTTEDIEAEIAYLRTLRP